MSAGGIPAPESLPPSPNVIDQVSTPVLPDPSKWTVSGTLPLVVSAASAAVAFPDATDEPGKTRKTERTASDNNAHPPRGRALPVPNVFPDTQKLPSSDPS